MYIQPDFQLLKTFVRKRSYFRNCYKTINSSDPQVLIHVSNFFWYRFMDRTYSQKMAMGSSMGNPMGFASNYGGTGYSMYGPNMTGGYVAKSRLKTPSTASVRSKSMRSGMSRRSHMSKRKPTKRFNEQLDTMSTRSKPSRSIR